MKYEDISDLLILNYETLKITIYEEIKPLLLKYTEVTDKWRDLSYQMTPTEVMTQKPTNELQTFGILITLFTEAFFPGKAITKQMVREVIDAKGEFILGILASHLYNEFPRVKDFSVNSSKIQEVIEQNHLVSSADYDFHLMRDMVTKKREFIEDEDGNYASEIIDNRGTIKGVAKLQPYELEGPTLFGDAQEVWLETLGETLNSLDDLTADLFDLISFLWLTSPKSSDGYLEFHSDDALRIRGIKEIKSRNGSNSGYREEDRFNIMRRVAALSSIWVSLAEKKVHIINAKEVPQDELYKFKDFQKLFEVGKIRVAYDSQTGKTKGIYALQIRPTSLLTRYLDGPKRTLGVLDLRVLQYSHVSHRPHKRLTRYLNLQWRIRTVKKSLFQPFKVSTLLKEMDFASRYRPGELRDKFENTLDDLQKDNVIQNWSYVDGIDEDELQKRSWFNNYWTKLLVQIVPPDPIIKENKKKLQLNSPEIEDEVIDRIQTLSDFNWQVQANEKSLYDYKVDNEININTPSTEEVEEITLSPESMKETLEKYNISIRQAAEEIGMSHTTLSRYLRKESKRQNKKNDEKMLRWLIEKKKS
ncbi:helix-turn-helix transcriptional regulator [Cytobacillus gottheilii]|uniref:helix-turn-helix transcriptional regulator n=1 Tax=Cytobacillus gottheilii TaxID=859144 RepID=UPI002494D40F|nr:helix-turn-helix transcriptional regulator [Cytobacillus gottheilii]